MSLMQAEFAITVMFVPSEPDYKWKVHVVKRRDGNLSRHEFMTFGEAMQYIESTLP